MFISTDYTYEVDIVKPGVACFAPLVFLAAFNMATIEDNKAKKDIR
jgi:hypothetical protein